SSCALPSRSPIWQASTDAPVPVAQGATLVCGTPLFAGTAASVRGPPILVGCTLPSMKYGLSAFWAVARVAVKPMTASATTNVVMTRVTTEHVERQADTIDQSPQDVGHTTSESVVDDERKPTG